MKKKNEISIRSSAAEYLTFVAATGDNKEAIEVRYEDENIWLTQKMLSTLYNVEINTINYHIKKIYSDNELDNSTVAFYATVQQVGNRKVFINIEYYNLDMIISIGYRVKSKRGIEFRRWANKELKEYLIKYIYKEC